LPSLLLIYLLSPWIFRFHFVGFEVLPFFHPANPWTQPESGSRVGTVKRESSQLEERF
jgi:hypothetical protein